MDAKQQETRGSSAASFAGMHETGRGNELGLEEHTSFGAMTEGATKDEASSDGECTDLGPDARARRKPADEESTGGVDTGEVSDIRPRRLPNRAENILKYSSWVSVAMGFNSIVIMVMAQWAANVGDMGTEELSIARWAAGSVLAGAGMCICAAKMLVIFFVVGMPLYTQ